MIDKNKTYRTRDGREVRIYATDNGGFKPVHGATAAHYGWCLREWNEDGTIGAYTDPCDLIEVKPRIKRTVWLNVYRDRVKDGVHECKGEADYHADRTRLACVKVEIDCEEGEGL
jgi:hypothetical protein